MRDTKITNLAPLAPLPPWRLILNNETALDLSPLQRSQLVDLNITDANIATVLPLFNCPRLESVAPSRTTQDVYLLRRHPTLRHLGYNVDEKLRRPKTMVAEFFAPAPRSSSEGLFKPGNALAAGTFDEPKDFTAGWTGRNARGQPVSVVWTSDPLVEGGRGGGSLSFLEKHGDNATGYFSAAPTFLGNQSAAYGGSLKFRMRQAHPPTPGNPPIELHSGATRLVHPLPSIPSQIWNTYSVPLHESANWKIGDDRGPVASAEVLRRVLGKLDRLMIPAEFGRDEEEKTDLDEVTLTTAAQDEAEAKRLAALAAIVESMIAPWESGRGEEALTIYRQLVSQTGTESVLASAHAVFARGRWKTAWFKSSADPVARLDEWRALATAPAATEVEVPAIAFVFDQASPGKLGISPALAERDPGRTFFGMIAKTRLNLPAGKWRFAVRSDDGCRLLVDGKVVLENWRGHLAETTVGERVQEQTGDVDVVLEYFQNDLGAEVALTLQPILPAPASAPVATLAP